MAETLEVGFKVKIESENAQFFDFFDRNFIIQGLNLYSSLCRNVSKFNL